MKNNSLPIFSDVKAAAPPPPGMPFLRLGFRPFYLGGALLAVLNVPLWVGMLLGQIELNPVVSPLLWHAHEMLFGFAVAIIVGFLMTAGKAWTGLPTPRGPWLGALALLWLAARIASVTGPYGVFAMLDLALLPLVAGILTSLLLQSRNYRNLPLALILALLAMANLLFHLSAMGLLGLSAIAPLHAALALVVMMLCVMAGRVIPAFTMAVTPGLKLVANVWVERTTLAATGLGLVGWIVGAPAVVSFALLALASGLHVRRLLVWRSPVVAQRPILWILHASYAWIPLGLALLALAQMGWVEVSTGVHALAVGALGGIIMGMITRTARGHTGRPLTVSRAEVLAYVLVMSAAVLRVLLPLLVPSLYAASLVMAAAAWSVAFVIYLWIFTPWLMATRLDGKDG